MSQTQNKGKSLKKPGKTTLKAVSAASPCPVCGKDHKCSLGADGLILCGRESDEVPGFVCLGPADGDPQFTLYRVDGAAPPAAISSTSWRPR